MDISSIVLVCGIVAFAVTIITELTKDISFLARIPTALQVITLSLILTPLGFAVYAAINSIEMPWYMWIIAVLLGFAVAFITMYGWDKLAEIWNRLVKPNKKGD